MNIKEKLEAIRNDSENELEIYVIDDILEADEPEVYLKDLLSHGCQSGMVSSLIYYVDTKAFYIKYIDEIDELREEMEDSTGESLKIGSPSYNWLAWFGYEEMARKVAEKLGMEI